MAEPSLRQRYLKRDAALRNERASYIDHYRDISDLLLPRRSRFLATEANKGSKKNTRIINSIGTRSLRTLASGMMSGLTSPSRPWFKFAAPDPSLMEIASVREWLEECERITRDVFHRSNIYSSLAQVYEDEGAFGTAAMNVEEDDTDVLRAYVFPCGSYCLAADGAGRINTLYHDCTYTVGQMVKRWGLEACSTSVQTLYAAKNLDAPQEILHVIEPNDTYEHGRLDARGKRWSSTWIERKGQDDKILGVGGYHEFPVMAPRWAVTGEDVYGSSPGMDALGDVTGIQVLEKKKAQGLEKIVNPHYNAPASLKQAAPSTLPGYVTYVDTQAGGQKFEPSHLVDPKIVFLKDEIAAYERRIQQAFYADLFLMLSELDRPNMTATEVNERRDEKLQRLGPVYELNNDELLDPLIDRTFAILLRRGMLPPPPEELQDMELNVEYVSIMAQTQKLVKITGIERLALFTKAVAETHPEALDVFDADQAVTDYGEGLGTPTGLIRTPEQLKKFREAKAQERQMQQMAAMARPAKDGAQAVAALANAPVDQNTVLGAVVAQA